MAITSQNCFLTYIDKMNIKQVLLHSYLIFFFSQCIYCLFFKQANWQNKQKQYNAQLIVDLQPNIMSNRLD